LHIDFKQKPHRFPAVRFLAYRRHSGELVNP
jgi:hypothetical protein